MELYLNVINLEKPNQNQTTATGARHYGSIIKNIAP